MNQTLLQLIERATKDAMRAKDKKRLLVLRSINAEFKRFEIDERLPINDEIALIILNKMRKQRLQSVLEYRRASRKDLLDQEQFELDILAEFLPKLLSEQELVDLVKRGIETLGVTQISEIGKVMQWVKQEGKEAVDLSEVAHLVKIHLT